MVGDTLEGVSKAFSELEASLEEGREVTPQAALRLVSKLNRGVGRLARLSPSADITVLKEFQRKVNAVTVAVKGGNYAEARIELRRARVILEEEPLKRLLGGKRPQDEG
jgi:hypothetical protein